MIRALIFDFDFTLGDSAAGIVLCANFALRGLGYAQRSREEIAPTIGLALPDTFSALTGKRDEREAALFADLFHEEADRVMVAHTQIYAGVLDHLRRARERGIRTAIVTTKHHYRIGQILEKYEAGALIDCIVGVEDVSAAKPAPEGLILAINALGVRREEALYVGDSLVDAKAARNAGVPFAAVLTGTTKREAFEKEPRALIAADVNEVFRRVLAGAEAIL